MYFKDKVVVEFARKRVNLQEKDNPERKRAGPAVVAPSDCGGPGSRRGRTDLERGVCDYRTMANGGMMETDLSGDPGMKGKSRTRKAYHEGKRGGGAVS